MTITKLDIHALLTRLTEAFPQAFGALEKRLVWASGGQPPSYSGRKAAPAPNKLGRFLIGWRSGSRLRSVGAGSLPATAHRTALVTPRRGGLGPFLIQTAEFDSLGYTLVDGEWTRPDDPTWNLPRQQQVDT